MAGPSRIFALYTADELTEEIAACKLEIRNGAITSISGAAKSSAFSVISPADKMKALILEMRHRGLAAPRAQKVQSRFDESGYYGPGTVTE